MIPSTSVQPRIFKFRMADDTNYQALVKNKASQLKAYIKLDGSLFLLSSVAALTNAFGFGTTRRHSKTCLLFAKMYELKRIVIPGPITLCNCYMVTSCLLVFICCWFLVKTFQNSSFRLGTIWSKALAAFVPALAIFNYVLLMTGNQAFCDSFDVHKFCSSELLHNTDFKTFTPKYLDAYSYFDFCKVSSVSLILLCVFWIAGWVCHFRKHSRRSTPL